MPKKNKPARDSLGSALHSIVADLAPFEGYTVPENWRAGILGKLSPIVAAALWDADLFRGVPTDRAWERRAAIVRILAAGGRALEECPANCGKDFPSWLRFVYSKLPEWLPLGDAGIVTRVLRALRAWEADEAAHEGKADVSPLPADAPEDAPRGRAARRNAGRKNLPSKEEKKRFAILAAWERAHGAGVTRKTFCKDKSITVAYLEDCQDWKRQRDARAKGE